jgi:hypothetical protein
MPTLPHFYCTVWEIYWRQRVSCRKTFFQAYYTLKRYPAEHIRTLALRAWLYKIAGIDVL